MLIVGAGVYGLIMAIEARKRGIKDNAILEKADEIGGTWPENTYPGVACDIPSHLYSMATHLKVSHQLRAIRSFHLMEAEQRPTF
ncbi:NAD(P)-binding protein [Ruegeria sp. A3M17]|uniref:NAD(P)-binding protein n=1 Tax=Ruegeria sp. A3M17 TaxID=2267229 RepID=UPI000E06996A|nr:NAD(P)-binding protein [Ruegeria sp. A3M17]RBW58725.1 hypothetical protein DS906_07945 [Ruegeria sp. A3M17]